MTNLTRASCALVLLFSMAGTARADDALEKAKRLFKQAETHFSVREFKEALALYKQAYKAKPLPELLFNIGQAHRHLGDCKSSAFFFNQYLLKKQVSDDIRAEIKRLNGSCKPTAAVTPPTSQPASQPNTGTGTGTGTGAGTGSGVGPDPGTDSSSSGLRTWAWVSAVAAAALFATAGITGGIARSKNSDYLDPATPFDDLQGLRDSGRALETTSYVTLGVGAAAAVAAVVLFISSSGSKSTADDSGTPAKSKEIAITVSPTGASFALRF